MASSFTSQSRSQHQQLQHVVPTTITQQQQHVAYPHSQTHPPQALVQQPSPRVSMLPFKRFTRVTLRFRLPYYTQWGQNLMICGSDLSVGRWSVKQGLWMSPHHEGQNLVWTAVLSVPEDFEMEYKYVLVDEKLTVLKWESGDRRSLRVPRNAPDGSVIDIIDTWQDGSNPELLLSRPAFRNIVFRSDGDSANSAGEQTAEFLAARIPGDASSEDPAALVARSLSALQIEPLPAIPASQFEDKELVIVRFRISCLRMKLGQKILVSGSAPSLGQWDYSRAIKLKCSRAALWEGDVRIRRSEFPFRYKYLLQEDRRSFASSSLSPSPSSSPAPPPSTSPLSSSSSFPPPSPLPEEKDFIPEHGIDLELGSELTSLSSSSASSSPSPALSGVRKASAMIIVTDGFFRSFPWRGVGVAIPVFALRSSSPHAVGVGEFLDLLPLIDLASRTGMRMVQLLPVNDTSVTGTWWDSYPYSTLSVFALHPLYLRLQRLSNQIPPPIQAEIEAARISLDLKAVDYTLTMKTKLGLAKKIFVIEGERVLRSKEFCLFFQENQSWLEPYAAFCFLRDLFGSSDHSQWGLFAEFSRKKIERLVAPGTDHHYSIAFHYYLQFHLHLQLLEASQYALSHHVLLKGDLPIGVDRHSVDTWTNKGCFRMNKSTGAPPDDFSALGQNWGFPTYDWEAMERDNYSWWRARLTQMSKYFSAYRIDHVLGFFRIWELPEHAVSGLIGKFRPAIPISAEEMEREGVWDFDRLCYPYIPCHLLQEKFGARWSDIASKYFDEHRPTQYRFKPEFSTEKALLASCHVREDSPDWMKGEAVETSNALMEIMQDVVLIRDDDDEKKFHPRFNCDSTQSFKELNQHTQNVIKRLYVDYFFSRQESLWKSNALKSLPALLNSSNMLPCAEDLGLVPACVPPVLSDLGLLGLRIQRMSAVLGQEFGNPANYPYLTVCSPSCHDTTPLRAWWEESEERRKSFFVHVFGTNETPPATCTPAIAQAIIQQHCDSPSIFSVFAMQDLMALRQFYHSRPSQEETINDPTNPKHYWRFRIHVCIEDLLNDEELISTIQEIVLSSGRAKIEDFPASERGKLCEMMRKIILESKRSEEAQGRRETEGALVVRF